MNLGWTSRQRWWVLAVGWLALLVLGVWGFVRQADELGLDVPFLDHLYFTLQLAALSYGGESEAINWQLQIARFAAPVLAASTLLQSASVVFREQFDRWRARRARDHTIVCGLDGVGTRLVEALVADGRPVVAVDPGTHGSAGAIGELGVPVIAGEPTDAAVLAAAGVARASRLVAATPADGVNVAIVAAVRELPRRSARPLRCSVRVTDGDLAALLRSTELGREGHAGVLGDSVRVDFFNVHERAAHALVAAHPVTAGDERGAAHLVMLGLGQFGAAVLLTAAQRAAERGDAPLAVTVVDRVAAGRLRALSEQHPALTGAIDAVAIPLDLDAPDPDAAEALDARLAAHPPTLVVVAFEDESQAWASGLAMRRRLHHPVDVIVRTNSDGGLGQQLDAAVADRDPGGGRIVSFPVYANASSLDLIEGGVREQLAGAIHDDYLAARAGSDGAGSALARPWTELTDVERESSRSAADGIVTQLATVGYRLVPLTRWGALDTTLADAEVDALAAAEHARWRAEREATGWRWGEVRDDAAKTNPLLLAWDALDEATRAQNRASTAALPAMLARAGFELSR